MTEQAIAAWHDLLTPELAGDAAAWLGERQRDRGLTFGERPLCTVLRPRFLDTARYDALRAMSRGVLSALRTAGEAALADREFRKAFRLADWEESLIASTPRTPAIAPLSRIDAFIDPADGVARLTEFNGETPAGTGYVDVLAEIFLSMPVMHRFSRNWVVRPLPARHHLLGVLIDTWQAVRTTRATPTIAIVDWDDVPTLSEFRIMRDYATAMGVTFRITTPEALAFDGNTLRDADGTAIDLVYKRILLHELVAECGLDHPLLRAVRTGAVVMINGVHSKPLHKKASLAVLTDERHADRFSREEQQSIHRHVPWTRVVEERHTELDGERIDLLPWIARHREQLVLKPNDDYGGAGIVLGWEVSADEWTQAVSRATDEPYVVQRRIALPSEPFPAIHEGSVVIDDRIVDTAPFCWDTSWMDGTLTRISTSTLVNVTAGGGSTVPTFVVEPR